ncbi:hypothetical protein, partial [Calidithermus terrae]|uniref:hypothetical protein n=1 Tax=Calidithermus terrae TaxID=1408545 RepID=UPI0011C40965
MPRVTSTATRVKVRLAYGSSLDVCELVEQYSDQGTVSDVPVFSLALPRQQHHPPGRATPPTLGRSRAGAWPCRGGDAAV